MTSPFGPLTAGNWRHTRRPHSTPLISRTRSTQVDNLGNRVDGTVPNTMNDVYSNPNYVEHYIWTGLDLEPYMHPDDAGKEILYAKFAIKLIISNPTTGLEAIAVKIVPPSELVESAPTDFQQPSGSNWTENIAQIACLSYDTPRQWQECIVAPEDNIVNWGGCFRPDNGTAQLGMAFAIFLDGYCVAAEQE